MALPSISMNCRVIFGPTGVQGSQVVDWGVNASTPITCAPSPSVGIQVSSWGTSTSTASVGVQLGILVDSTFPPAVGARFPVSYHAPSGIIQDTWTRTA